MEKPGRNEPCYCGSGKKFKRCCYNRDLLQRSESAFFEAAVGPSLMVPFEESFPEIAKDETRFIWALGRRPSDKPFMLSEHYCGDPSCHCNRLIIGVIDLASPKTSQVTVGYAFDRSDRDPGPYIDQSNPCTQLGRQLFPIVEGLLAQDTAYVERLRRHYMMVKAKVSADDPERAKVIEDPRVLYRKNSNGRQDWPQ